MKRNLKKVLSELYKLDPTLKEHEQDIVRIITLMMENKPNAHVDETFVKELRQELVGSFTESYSSSLSSFFSMKKVALFAGAAGVLSVALVVGMAQLDKPLLNTNTGSIAALFSPHEVVKKSSGAFGSLAMANTAGAGAGNAMEARGMTSGFGGGGGAPSVDQKMAVSPLIYPVPMYTYKYVGDPIEIPGESLPVYRRVQSDLAAQSLANQLKHAGAGLLNLGTFGQTKVDSINLNNGEYSINLDIVNARASIFPTWYRDSDVPSRQPSEADIPSDAKLVEMAESFLTRHEVNTSVYGNPVVDHRWRKDRDRHAIDEASKTYVPHVISVVFPYSLEGKTVQDYGGMAEGMRVNINIVENKIESVWNILAGSFESSNYAVETNSETLKEFAEQGGLSTPWYSENAEKITLDLGTPTLVYVQYHLPRTEGNWGDQEMYVPALQFSVVNAPTDKPYFYQDTITIPIAKEIIELAKKEQVNPPVTILKEDPAVSPLIEDAR